LAGKGRFFRFLTNFAKKSDFFAQNTSAMRILPLLVAGGKPMKGLFVKAPCLLLLFGLLWSCSLLEWSEPEKDAETEEAFLAERWRGKGTVSNPSEHYHNDPEEEGEEGEYGGLPDDEPLETVFLNWEAMSESEIVFEFSQPVTEMELDIIPCAEIGSIEDGGNAVRVIFEESLEPGQWYEAEITAVDPYENIVNVQVSFRYRPGQIPELLITELRTEHSNPKAEFIELRMLSDGNLEGLQVFISNYTRSKPKNPLVYEFKSAEVKKGQYVVLHLRTLEESCVSEYNGKIDESGGTDSSSAAWDFWIEGKTEFLRKTEAVYVIDSNDWVLDAVMFADPQDTWNDVFDEIAAFLFVQGAWKSNAGTVSGQQDAVISGTTTTTRTICRDETIPNSHTAADWYITVTSGATPGKPNNPSRFVE
jgi:hypothetical protein